jgi:hypothetical protein
MSTTQLPIHLPDELVRRFKRNVSVRQRSKFIQRLLEEALPPEDGGDGDALYQAALAVEGEHALASEMAEWDTAAIDCGLGQGDAPRTHVSDLAWWPLPTRLRSARRDLGG